LEAVNAMMPTRRNEPIGLTRVQDLATHQLFKLAIDGTVIPNVTVDFAKDGRTVTRLQMTNVLIEQFTPVPGEPPMESLSLNPAAITFVVGAATGAVSGAAAHMKL
jgi:type VI protein secretion system component Hcp